MTDITLKLAGRIYGGWTSARVSRGIDRLAGAFRLDLSDFDPQAGQRLNVIPGDACEIAVDGTVVITGFLDRSEPRYDATAHDISITGRSRTADLIDCSAMNSPGSWNNRKLDTILPDVCKPFGIAVAFEADPGPAFETAKLQSEETAFAFIERLCALRGLLAHDSTQGTVVIARAGAGRADVALVRGENILSGEISRDAAQRYSRYIVRGQDSGGDHKGWGRTVAQRKGMATDPQVGRYRPLTVVLDAKATVENCQERANWEMVRRAGEALQAVYTVHGWRQFAGGPLWMDNLLVSVADDLANLDRDMLIVEVEWTISDGGALTRLHLRPPEAFAPAPEAPEGLGWDKKKKNDNPPLRWDRPVPQSGPR